MRALQLRRALWLFVIASVIVFFASKLAAAPASSDGKEPAAANDVTIADDDDDDDDDNRMSERPKIYDEWFQNPVAQILYFDDSDYILALERAGKVRLSDDGGRKWEDIEDLGEGKVLAIQLSPSGKSKKVAIALGDGRKHWITRNRGKDWKAFEIEGLPAYRDQFPVPLLSWHSEDEHKIIMNTRVASQGGQIAQAVYTDDAFESPPKSLRTNARQCLWANEQEHFTSSDSDIDRDRILCVALGKYSSFVKDQRLVMSNDYFKTEREPRLERTGPVSGIVSIVSTKAFILAARQTQGTKEMALYATINTKKWRRADFGDHQIVENGYTIMESTNYSLQVDVSASTARSVHMGTLYTSNSRGGSFVRNEVYTNRNSDGWVDFEKIAGIQGVALVNIVANADAVIKTGALKQIKSKITFDDGRHFLDLNTDDDEKLHLHSVTERNNIGRTFSNLAPGIVMGNGNTGSELDAKAKSDLYISDNAGASFKLARKGSHLYEIGDQGSIILAIEDEQVTDTLSYSLDHGKSWKKISLDDYNLKKKKGPIKALTLSNPPDSTGLKFLLNADIGVGSELDHYIYMIDFDGLDKRECKQSDFEDWYARLDQDKKPRCIMGHTQKFRRRKADADCVIGTKFKDPVPIEENCSCNMFDFECNVGFYRSEDRASCLRLDDNPIPADKCKDGHKTFKDTSGWRKIPGNTCIGKGAEGPPPYIERPCPENGGKPPASRGEITSKETAFEADRIVELFYLERGDSSTGDDETIILLTNEHEVFVSHDHGKKFERKEMHDRVVAIYPHKYVGDQVYLITPSTRVYYSKNRGKDFNEFDAPAPPNNRLPILRFHAAEEDWLIWTSCEDTKYREKCKAQSFVSTKNGDKWDPMLKGVEDCEFIYREDRETSKHLVYCMQHKGEDNDAPLQLLSSNDWFEEKKTIFEDMINFATMSEYIIVAAKTGKSNQYLKVDASIDGEHFADAKFPANLKVEHSNAYTVLDSSTHSIFLHVTINAAPDQEFGSIIKSNSNGTSYTMCLENVNRDKRGYVDFEKMHALPGTAVANVLVSVEDTLKGKGKKLRSMITHDDGATWGFLNPPEYGINGRKLKCNLDKGCSLHLHGFTERDDPRDTYSSPAAVGLMLGVGNVGEFLKPKRDSNTFISRDGGVSWKLAMEGQYMWEFGDRGGLIVIVDGTRYTNVVYYSTDEGDSWTKYEFSERKMVIFDITTVPSDTSRNFLLQGKDGSKAVTINIDFSGLISKECKVGTAGKEDSDYDLWEPKHPGDTENEDNCLFGHVSQYLRKKPSSDCFNPLDNFPDKLVHIKKNCSCTRQDFECDYNYERGRDGACQLVPGRKPLNTSKVCKKPGVDEYWEPTGYRRLPMSTCDPTTGKDYQFPESKRHPCPGKEEEYKKKHGGISGVGLFFAIVLPIGAAAAIGWWMWRHMEGRFGRIRLGDVGGEVRSVQANAYRRDWTKYPVMAVSGVVAVAMAVPMLLGIMWRSVRERMPGGRRSFYSTYGRSGHGEYGNGAPYTSRDSFSRGGRDYSDGPHNDERDLLGEDSDED